MELKAPAAWGALLENAAWLSGSFIYLQGMEVAHPAPAPGWGGAGDLAGAWAHYLVSSRRVSRSQVAERTPWLPASSPITAALQLRLQTLLGVTFSESSTE